MDDLPSIPDLLHDATFQGLQWQAHERSLRVFFESLRRPVDEVDAADSPIELRFVNVTQLAFFSAPANDTVRPSEVDFQSQLENNEETAWEECFAEAVLHLDSRVAQLEWDLACHRKWIYRSDETPEKQMCAIITLLPLNYADGSLKESVFVVCDSIQPMSEGKPLSLDTWRSQYQAWWENWRETVDEDPDIPSDDDEEDEAWKSGSDAVEEDIVLGGSSEFDDANYAPPRKAAFLVAPNDVPPEILSPIEAFHVGLLEGDWRKVRGAAPRLDEPEGLSEEELAEAYLNDGLGSWSYIRQVDSWWREGERACVVVRGMEHTMPEDDDPAEDCETVIAYGLRHFEGRWIIWSSSQGWPEFGSAPELYEEPEWKKEWD